MGEKPACPQCLDKMCQVRISPNEVHSVTILLGSNVGPESCWDEARQMTDVRCCNDQVCSGDIQCECLSRYQHITIQLFRISRWYASVTRLSPEFGGEPQCYVGQGKVAISR